MELKIRKTIAKEGMIILCTFIFGIFLVSLSSYFHNKYNSLSKIPIPKGLSNEEMMKMPGAVIQTGDVWLPVEGDSLQAKTYKEVSRYSFIFGLILIFLYPYHWLIRLSIRRQKWMLRQSGIE